MHNASGKKSKKYTALLLITIFTMFLLMLGVHIIAGFTNFGIAFLRSGTFENVHQSIHDSGWEFSADKANGHNTIFISISRETMENFFNLTITAKIADGEMLLTISQGEISEVFNLSGDEFSISTAAFAYENMPAFSYGRFEMRLDFVNAIDVYVNVEW